MATDSLTDDVIRGQLAELGLAGNGAVHRNLPPAELIARSLARGEGILAANGALVVKTGEPSGRSPEDRVIVEEGAAAEQVCWGDVNKPCKPALFDRLLDKARGYLHDRDLYVFDGFAGAERTYRLPIRVVADATWHALFANTLFVRPTPIELEDFVPGFTVINCGALRASADFDGTRTSVFVGISFTRKLVLILGSMYGGEMKKAIFSVMNYLLPQRNVLPMHCSANVGESGDVALFFGLSGTGKTTLSADPERRLIGDDEHGWSDHSIFNFEGGCYAKTIRLSAGVRAADLQRDQVRLHPRERDRRPADAGHRLRLRLPHREHARHLPDRAHPRRRARRRRRPPAQRLLPHLRRLRRAAAHLASSRPRWRTTTSSRASRARSPAPRWASTSRARPSRPASGRAFMPLHASRYATMLAERLSWHETDCWLVNTGWTGGPYGVGQRMSIELTRGAASGRPWTARSPGPASRRTPSSRCSCRTSAAARRRDVLDPRASWADKDAYDAVGAQARRACSARTSSSTPRTCRPRCWRRARTRAPFRPRAARRS